MSELAPVLPYTPNNMASRADVARLARTALWIGLITAIVFSLFPSVDIAVSRLFLTPDATFAMNESGFWRFLRWLFLRSFAVWYIVIIGAELYALSLRQPVFSLTWPKWLYLALCSIAGPLVLTNWFLKEEWGRWRPREVSELTGSEQFTSPLDWTGTCADNCSFVSGEVSSMVMIFVSLALVTGRLKLFYWLAGLMGVLSMITRVGQGGHFLSDTLFAAVFMMLIAAGVFRLMFLGRRPLATETDFDGNRLIEAHDRFFATICDKGLAWLDRVAPRNK